MELAERVKMLCKLNNISQRDLEERLGMGNALTSKWHTSVPNASNVVKIADYFGISTDSLLNRKRCKCFESYEVRSDHEEKTTDVIRLVRLMLEDLQNEELTFGDEKIAPELRKFIENAFKYSLDACQQFHQQISSKGK